MNLQLLGQMNFEEALGIVDPALQQQGLNNIQELVFRSAWAGSSD